LSGNVERVTYHNEENGFAVLRVKVKGHKDLVSVIGTVPSIILVKILLLRAFGVIILNMELNLKLSLLNQSPLLHLRALKNI
jgi:hypothetical protein